MNRLPRGRHGLSPEYVARNQRDRLIAALIEVLHEVGYQKTTVSLIGARAAVSKSDFYRHFESKDDCFFAAYDAAVERLRAGVAEACERRAGDAWPLRVRAGLETLLGAFAADPPLANVCLVEGLRVGPKVYDRYQAAIEGFVSLMREGAPRGPGGAEVPRATDEAIIGGLASLLGRRVQAGETQALGSLLPAVLEFALTPYLGTAEARRIVSAG